MSKLSLLKGGPMNAYYDVIQLTKANESPCEQIGVRYGEKLVVLRNLQDALTFLYCEKFFLKYSKRWKSINEIDRLNNIESKKGEVCRAIDMMEKELSRKDFVYIEKLLMDEAEERNWVYSIDLYDTILRLDERYV